MAKKQSSHVEMIAFYRLRDAKPNRLESVYIRSKDEKGEPKVNPDRSSLIAVIEKLKRADIIYSLGGSGLMHSLGLTDEVGDWDVMVEAPKEQVIHALQHDRIEEKKSGDYPFGTKYKLVVHSDGPEVEIICGLSIHANKGLCNLSASPSFIWNDVHVGSPEVWYVAYSLMNRSEKAAKLLAYLKEVGANQQFIQVLLKEPLPDEIMGEIRSLIET